MGLVFDLARRGIQHASTSNLVKRGAEKPSEEQIPAWGVAVLVGTFFASVIFLTLVDYTLRLVATLAMVETPSAAITVSASQESAPKDVKESSLESGPTITLVHQKPITSGIRRTIAHIVAQAGPYARWRGFKIHMLHSICFSVLVNIFDGLTPSIIPGRIVLITGISGALLANLHATWTHKVVAVPTTAKFWSRVVPRSYWKQLALPAAVESAAKYLCVYVAMGLMTVLNFTNEAALRRASGLSVTLRTLSVFAVMLACTLFIVLPAKVTQIRVEASVLPEDQDTIVPFDRSFEGKVVPKILGGTGAIGFVDAWKSFNWEARRRLVKIYVKTFFITSALAFVVGIVFGAELYAILGSRSTKFLSAHLKTQGL